MKTKNGFRFQAHRGDSAFFPENTIPAFESAAISGFDVIETDPKFTSDKHVVLLHDKTLSRTCRNGDGSPVSPDARIDGITLAEAKKLDAGIFMGERFAGTRIPTLAEALAFIKRNNVSLKIDNVIESFPDDVKDRLFDDVRRSGAERSVGFTCRTADFFEYAAKAFPLSEMHYDGDVTPETAERLAKAAPGRLVIWAPYDNAATSWCKKRKADAEICAFLSRYGKVGVWIISEKEELEKCVGEYGADIIETNGALRPGAYGGAEAKE